MFLLKYWGWGEEHLPTVLNARTFTVMISYLIILLSKITSDYQNLTMCQAPHHSRGSLDYVGSYGTQTSC